jgi:hypothetical protein
MTAGEDRGRGRGARTGSGPANIFTTLGRHPRLFRAWLRSANVSAAAGVLRSDGHSLLR